MTDVPLPAQGSTDWFTWAQEVETATDDVRAKLIDATTTNKGLVQLAGDLGGTATAPTVPDLAGRLSSAELDAAYQQAFLVSEFAETGDADDTLAIQRALDAAAAAGGGLVLANGRRKTYTVRPQGTRPIVVASGATVNIQVCVNIPSSVTLDMRGATVTLAGITPATMFCNSNMTTTGTRNTDVGLRNVTVNGGGLTLTDAGLVTFTHASRVRVDNLRMTNSVYQGLYLVDVDNSFFGYMEADAIQGQPFTIGAPSGTSNMVYDTSFGIIRARDITELNTTNQPGNGLAAAFARCTVQSIEVKNCAAGIKIMGPSEDCTIGRILCDTTGHTASGNSGVKLQGDTGNGWYPQRIAIGEIVARNNNRQGLYLERSIDCSVGSYTGQGNNTAGASGQDVWLGGTRDQVGLIKSIESGAGGVLVRNYSTDLQLGTVQVTNCGKVTGSASTESVGFTQAGGNTQVDSLTVRDNQGTPTTHRCITITGGAFDCTHVRAVGGVDRDLILYTASNSTVGNPRLGATPLTHGEVTLAASATTTAVSSSSFTAHGTNLQPDIALLPMNSAARALTGLRWTVAAGTLTIHHSAADGTEKIRWRLVGYLSGATNVS